jgi:DNA-binding CsgD family transcriptional regulator
VDRIDLETLTALLDERLGGLPLTPGDRAEALCIALGVDPELSAVARGVSAGTVRARRRRLRLKLERGLRTAAAGRGPEHSTATARRAIGPVAEP